MLLVFLANSADLAQAQVPTTTTTPASTPPDLASDIQELNNRLIRLEQEQENQRELVIILLTPLALLVGLLTAGGVAGLITSVRTENRNSQLHALVVAGESASQARSEQVHASFLDSSQKTLGLVNDTLELAKDASERAVTTMSDKARRRLEALDRRAQEVVRRARLLENPKRIVEEAELTSPIMAIAGELQAIEGFLALQDIELTSSCLFIRGMDRHLKQDSTAAVSDLWDAVDSSHEDGLEDLALYWIGYEYNNLGQPLEASTIFKQAIARLPGTSRSTRLAYELRRIELESRFFAPAIAVGRGEPRQSQVAQVADIVEEGLKLVEEIEAQGVAALDSAIADISNTLGNMYTWLARNPAASDEGDELATTNYWDLAISMYNRSIDIASRADEVPWAFTFGRLQASGASSPGVPVDRPAYEVVRDQVLKRIPSRYERRSLVLLHQTRLICLHHENQSIEQLESAMQDLRTELRAVRPEVTLYSQISKCNLKREDFEPQVTEMFEQFRASRRSIGSA